MVNITNPLFRPSDSCWNWCSEQQIAHDYNIGVKELFILFTVLLSLVANRYIKRNFYDLKEHVDERALSIGDFATYYYAIAVLVLYLVRSVVL